MQASSQVLSFVNNPNEDELRLRSLCFPESYDANSTAPSVNSYLRRIYGDSVSSSNNNNSRSGNKNRDRSCSNMFSDTMSTTTTEFEERKVLLDRLNAYSFKNATKDTLKSEDVQQSGNTTSEEDDYAVDDEEEDDDDDEKDMCPRTPSPISDEGEGDGKYSLGKSPRGSMFISSMSAYNNPASAKRKPSQRRSKPISLTKAFGGLYINSNPTEGNNNNNNNGSNSNTPLSARSPSALKFDMYMGNEFDKDDDESVISPMSFGNNMSPLFTMNGTSDQIQRNQSGQFDSLKQFVAMNNLNTRGKSFTHRPSVSKMCRDSNLN
ncbi:Ics2p KNAG_0A03930 [Huiozyma naganishii CBS 8797]|uniref:Uncharacterized protein n=1 Tax=Huiozyma naganishii (strain ATCC MYA-139 / BCRC 22969 / CBS 8797 / KCTC 17520 / NBRC 10181 / NCYC 3082 / Yp74L-3) TaxID=1071383 RepID=J7RTK7_HUIN7|nr:hypothetical protein KNAG_0A03930 [Kazachstania naganishii CBS 8797]CCK68072.1 hypothetical protein KNAG_0A03930 [Kazachstania naganishii CBS 8797]